MNSNDKKLFPQSLDFESWLEHRQKTVGAWGTAFGKTALPEPDSKPSPPEEPEQEKDPREFFRFQILTGQFA